jgi:hypothetical protein
MCVINFILQEEVISYMHFSLRSLEQKRICFGSLEKVNYVVLLN